MNELAHLGSRAIFIFMTDGSGFAVAPSLDHLNGEVEEVDVRAGEYEFVDNLGSVYVFEPHAESGRERPMRFVAAGKTISKTELLSRLCDTSIALRAGADESDPLEFAQASADAAWELRWPKRPAWLSRRFHGDGPHRYLM